MALCALWEARSLQISRSHAWLAMHHAGLSLTQLPRISIIARPQTLKRRSLTAAGGRIMLCLIDRPFCWRAATRLWESKGCTHRDISERGQWLLDSCFCEKRKIGFITRASEGPGTKDATGRCNRR